jgi:hypothetical protein
MADLKWIALSNSKDALFSIHFKSDAAFNTGRFKICLPLTNSGKKLSYQFFDQTGNLVKPLLINGIINEFAMALGANHARPAKNGEVLGGNRLLEAETHVDVSDRQFSALFQQVDDPLAQFVVYRPQYQNSFSQLCVVKCDELLSLFQHYSFVFLLSHIHVFLYFTYSKIVPILTLV